MHSDGLQKRDYVYVTDLLRLLRLVLAGKPLNTELNVCSGITCSVRDIVAIVQKSLGTDIEPIYRDPSLLWEKSVKLWQGARPFPRERMKEEVEKFSLGNGEKAFHMLGWQPRFTIETGITDLCQNLSFHLSP